jgi:hypothetical protein
MRIDDVKRAHELLARVEKTEQHIAAYRAADKVVIGLNPRALMSLDHQLELTGAEIGVSIVAALEQRLEALRAELRELGVG